MAKVVERLKIREELESYIDFEGSVDSLREQVAYWEEHYAGKYFDLGIDKDYGCHSYYDDTSDSFKLIGYRFENDEEYNKRIAKNEKARLNAKEQRKKDKSLKEEKEKALYEELKEKYEGK